MNKTIIILTVFLVGMLSDISVLGEDSPHLDVMKIIKEKHGVNVKSIFATQCSWCHGGYGMYGGKGPKLAGTPLTFEQVVDRISNGKSGLMPGFKKHLGEEKINALAEYIKMLPKE
tara:strand:+ start:416 stop:763 length:348 start_codon:yes stop_codon:yes gene_type:complete